MMESFTVQPCIFCILNRPFADSFLLILSRQCQWKDQEVGIQNRRSEATAQPTVAMSMPQPLVDPIQFCFLVAIF